ncbi:MAG: HAD hydrolase family protein [Clostridia bacterium]|nr:HAD hydrolase family protein [Clostridia bacterium]
MGRFDGVLLCSDFDGTLSYGEKHISSANLAAIEYFKANGGQFTLASGRPPAFFSELGELIRPNAPLMTLNGGIIADPDTYAPLSVCSLDKGVYDLLLTEVFGNGITKSVHLWHGDGASENWFASDAVNPCDFIKSATGVLYKAVLVQSRQGAEYLRDRLRRLYAGKYLFERSWHEGLEILPPNGGKGAALSAIKKHCRFPVEYTVGVGDFENDVSLVRSADLGIAVGNALPCVKEAADRISAPNTQDALAQIIYEML